MPVDTSSSLTSFGEHFFLHWRTLRYSQKHVCESQNSSLKVLSLELSGVSREENDLRGNKLCDVKIDTPSAWESVSPSSTSMEFSAVTTIRVTMCNLRNSGSLRHCFIRNTPKPREMKGVPKVGSLVNNRARVLCCLSRALSCSCSLGGFAADGLGSSLARL